MRISLQSQVRSRRRRSLLAVQSGFWAGGGGQSFQGPRGVKELGGSLPQMENKQSNPPDRRHTLSEQKLNRTLSNPDDFLSATRSPYKLHSPVPSPPKAKTPEAENLATQYPPKQKKQDGMRRVGGAGAPPPRELRHAISEVEGSISSLSIDVPRRPSLVPVSHPQKILEGWLFKMGRRSFGKGYLHKRYFCLEGRVLNYWKHKPSGKQVPIRSILIEADTRIDDKGLEMHKGHAIYCIELYQKSVRHEQKIQIGESSPEKINMWKEAIERVSNNPGSFIRRTVTGTVLDGLSGPAMGSADADWDSSESMGDSFRSSKEDARPPAPLRRLRSTGPGLPKTFVDWASAENAESSSRAPDRHWKLLTCDNGLRFYEEIPDSEGQVRLKAMKAVGLVEASCDLIFNAIMALDETRYDWDATFGESRVVQHVDGHTDIIHQTLLQDILPWLIWPRDLCYTRYWRRKDDGSYEVLYQSCEHPDCPPEPGFVRANMTSGGYIISPVKPRAGQDQAYCRSRVEHVLQLDVRGWILPLGRLLLQRHSTWNMLKRVAGLREMFASSTEVPSFKINFASIEDEDDSVRIASGHRPKMPSRLVHNCQMPWRRKGEKRKGDEQGGNVQQGVGNGHDRSEKRPGRSIDGSAEEMASSSEDDPELDVQQVTEFESAVSAETDSPIPEYPPETTGPSLTTIFEELEELGTHRRGDLMKGKDSWSEPGGRPFKVRGKTFLMDRRKIRASDPLCRLVATDWYQSNKRIDHIATRGGGVVEHVAKASPEIFLFVVNMQVPGVTHYSMVFYFAHDRPLTPGSLLHRFAYGDDSFRNSRLKLIPSIPKGSWIVKQSVGSTPCLLGKALDCTYYQGDNYLEIDVDIGSSVVANGILGLAMGYFPYLTVDMAYLIQGNSAGELPEELLGAVRVSNLQLKSAVHIPQ